MQKLLLLKWKFLKKCHLISFIFSLDSFFAPQIHRTSFPAAHTVQSFLNIDAVYNHNQFSMFNSTNNNIKEDEEGHTWIIHELIGPEGNGKSVSFR